MLKKVRVGIAVLVFAFITIYFLDFAELLPAQFNYLTRIQFVPALLSLSAVWLIILIALALLFGRVYCSAICPLGIFQDVIGRINLFFRKKTKKKKIRYRYRKARNILRWSVVAMVLVSFLAGFPLLLGLIDPYSAYGRMVVSVFRPVYIAGNNFLETIFTSFSNYTFYKADASIVSLFAFIVGLLTFFAIGYFAWKHGRTYCNTVCPVGTLLGFLGKFSLFKIRIDHNVCNSCSLCETSCKAFCIDSKAQKIDYSRCVACFNCLDSCSKNAISFSYGLPKKNKVKTEKVDEGKRRFLTASLGSIVALPAAVAAGTGLNNADQRTPITPPGSKGIEHLMDHCTSCHLCISKCPANILKPAFTEYGLAGIMMPTMVFKNGFCNYDCTVCSEVCPNGAIQPLTVDEKHLTQVGKIILNLDHCIAFRDETHCGACAEHCPTQAVTMIPHKGALTIPETDQSICIGCGGCEYICPETGKAIYIEGNAVHQKAEMFKEAEKKEFDFDGFGF
ncbi:MAG: 4Fe-4S dicluster domain-containing protein [Prolixibacteraceae bacterium]|nr:4Fe-4S dicluster domain-containing protein [Prolixibacteraceae bacterium]